MMDESFDKENQFLSESIHSQNRVPFGVSQVPNATSEHIYDERNSSKRSRLNDSEISDCPNCEVLQARISKLESDCINYSEDKLKFQSEHGRLKGENNELSNKLAIKCRQFARVEAELSKLKNSTDFSDDRTHEVYAENQRLQRNISDIMAKYEPLSERNKKLTKDKERAESAYSNVVVELQRSISDNEGSSEDLRSTKLLAYIEDLRSIVETQKHELESLRSSNESYERELKNKDEVLLQKEEIIQTQKSRTKRRLSSRLSLGNDDLETVKISAELAREENSNLQRDLFKLRETIDQNHCALDDANSDIRKRNNLINDLKAEVSNLEKYADEHQVMKNKLEEMERGNDEMNELLAKKGEEISNLRADIERLEFEQEADGNKRLQQERDYQEARAAHERSAKELREMKVKVEEARLLCRNAQESEQRAVEKVKGLQRDLGLQHKQAKKKMRELDEQYHHENYKEKYTVAVERIRILESQVSLISHITDEMGKLSEEELALKAEQMTVHQEYSQASAKIESLKQQYEKGIDEQKGLMRSEYSKFVEELKFILERLSDVSTDFGLETACNSLRDLISRIVQAHDMGSCFSKSGSPGGSEESDASKDLIVVKKLKQYMRDNAQEFLKKFNMMKQGERQIQKIAEENKELLKRVEELERDKDGSLDQLELLPKFRKTTESNKELRSKLDQTIDQTTTYENTIRDLRTQCEVLQKAGTDFRESSHRHELRLDEERNKCEKYLEDIKKFKTEIFSLKNRNTAIMESMKSVETSKRQLRLTLDDRDACLAKEKSRLKTCKNNYHAKVQTLKQRIHSSGQLSEDKYQHALKREHDLSNQLEQHRQLLSERDETVSNLEADIEGLRRKSSQYTSQLSELSGRCEDQTNELHATKQDLKQMETDHNMTIHRYRQLETSNKDDPSSSRAFLAEQQLQEVLDRLNKAEQKLVEQTNELEQRTKYRAKLREDMRQYYKKGNERIREQYMRGKKLYQQIKFILVQLEGNLPELEKYNLSEMIKLCESVRQQVNQYKKANADDGDAQKLETPHRQIVMNTPMVGMPPRDTRDTHESAHRRRPRERSPIRNTRNSRYLNDWLSTPTLTKTRKAT